MRVRHILSNVCLRLRPFSQLFVFSAYAFNFRWLWECFVLHLIIIIKTEILISRCLMLGYGTMVCDVNKALSGYEEEPANNKGINELPTSRPLSSTFYLMAVTRYVCCIIWIVRIIIVCSHRRESMVVAEGLASILRQAICSHHDDEGLSMCLRRIPKWRCLAMILQNQSRAQQNHDHILWDIL